MPTEPQDELPTTEAAATRGPGRWRSLAGRLEGAVTGRMLLAATRWAVVFAFIATGFFGAAAVHSGVRHASAPGQQQILAAASAQK